MADKIAVMNYGKLQQFDIPKNIFERPFNEFVGSFIGEPPMNFFDCNLQKRDQEYCLVANSFDIKLPNDLKKNNKA